MNFISIWSHKINENTIMTALLNLNFLMMTHQTIQVESVFGFAASAITVDTSTFIDLLHFHRIFSIVSIEDHDVCEVDLKRRRCHCKSTNPRK